mgnify:FL=1
MTIYSTDKENKEIIKFKNDTKVADEYTMILDLNDLKLILDTITEEYITLSFGNHQAVVVKRTNISNVVPEVRAN